MTSQINTMRKFRDDGSAKAVSETASPSLATGSFSLAGALGYEDAEQCPKELVLGALELICGATDKPVSHDCERWYGDTPEAVGDYIAAVVAAGAVGVNIEDSLGDGSLRDVDEQCSRLAAANAASGEGYLNARTVFLFPGWRIWMRSSEYAALGVARISHGPFPWLQSMADLQAGAEALL